MGLLVLHRDPKKDRAEGGVHTGWMRLVCGRDSVGGEAVPRKQAVCQRRNRMRGHAGRRGVASEEGAVPRKGAV